MVLICGFSIYNLSLFHLFNHAIFKAALFLCAGAIIHSLNNEQDIRRMGALIQLLPISYITMFSANLAIIGFPFLTGFFSKDFIFEVIFNTFGVQNLLIF
jgi:NADH-ubiquinone oxidoreductase chain 5